jgi:cytochrome P450
MEKILHLDNLPKYLPAYEVVVPVIGPTSIITVSGDYWKKIRKMFNPAFANSHLETLVPGIVEESMVFLEILDKAAQNGEVLKFGHRLAVSTIYNQANIEALTMDVIAR